MTPAKMLWDKSYTSSCEQLDEMVNIRPGKKNVLGHKKLKVKKVASNKIYKVSYTYEILYFKIYFF